jgi:nucleotide-binding universal stress UspA family protein
MGIDTILVAVGKGKVAPSTFVDALTPLVESTGASVVLAHALTEDEAETAADRLDIDDSPGDENPAEGTPSGGQTSPYQKLWPTRNPTDASTIEDASDEVVAQLAAVSDLRDALGRAGIDHELIGTVGDPGPEIARLARQRDADLVLVGRRDRSAASEALFGSTSRDVVERSPVPVVVASDA